MDGGSALSILQEILQKETWDAFLADRTEKERLSREESAFFSSLIESGEYRSAAECVTHLSVVQKKSINKSGTGKKRTVYTYTPAENAALKVIAHLCYRFDSRLPDNLYSFRQNLSAKTAIRRIISARGIDGLYAYKLDIRDYFNSIPVAQLLPELRLLIADDIPLYDFFRDMLSTDEAMSEGRLVHEKRGVMAGTPTSPFLANVCLLPIDRHFADCGVLYARYSDDIILFAESEAELAEHRAYLVHALSALSLAVNTEKECTVAPHEAWTFLGISYRDGRVDIAESTKRKLMGKIRRKARALNRWKIRKNAGDMQAMRAFFRSINRKLYETSDDGRHFSWTRWFFPLVTTSDSLREIDDYIRQYARYVACGSFSASAYRVRQETLKSCGYRPLVAAYYAARAENAERAAATGK